VPLEAAGNIRHHRQMRGGRSWLASIAGLARTWACPSRRRPARPTYRPKPHLRKGDGGLNTLVILVSCCSCCPNVLLPLLLATAPHGAPPSPAIAAALHNLVTCLTSGDFSWQGIFFWGASKGVFRVSHTLMALQICIANVQVVAKHEYGPLRFHP